MPYKDASKRKKQLKNYYLKNKDKILVQAKQNHKDNKDARSAKHKEYYKKHRNEIRARMKEYSARNKSKISLSRKQYRIENKEKVRARKKEFYLKNKNKILVSQKRYYEENKNKIHERGRRYTNNSPKGRFHSYKWGAKVRGISFDISFSIFTFFWQKSCTYCGSEIPTIGIDRVDSSKGYIEGNIVSCCTMCNYMKRNYDTDTFLDQCFKITNYNK